MNCQLRGQRGAVTESIQAIQDDGNLLPMPFIEYVVQQRGLSRAEVTCEDPIRITILQEAVTQTDRIQSMSTNLTMKSTKSNFDL